MQPQAARAAAFQIPGRTYGPIAPPLTSGKLWNSRTGGSIGQARSFISPTAPSVDLPNIKPKKGIANDT